jgi:hypothetical protein
MIRKKGVCDKSWMFVFTILASIQVILNHIFQFVLLLSFHFITNMNQRSNPHQVKLYTSIPY